MGDSTYLGPNVRGNSQFSQRPAGLEPVVCQEGRLFQRIGAASKNVYFLGPMSWQYLNEGTWNMPIPWEYMEQADGLGNRRSERCPSLGLGGIVYHHSCHSHILVGLLQCASYRAAVEEHLEATAGPKCSGMDYHWVIITKVSS